MRFRRTPLAGAFIIEPERLIDERGFFARTFCREEFIEHGLNPDVAQCSVSFNSAPFTLRGMHRQEDPHAEDKIVRCTQGALFDVIVDMRRESATHCQWFGLDLTAENRSMLYIPKGVAHGFLTLLPDTEVSYQMSRSYNASSGRGARWNDPAFGIRWPRAPLQISVRDAEYPDYQP